MTERRAGLLGLAISLLLAGTKPTAQDPPAAVAVLPPFPKAEATITLKGTCILVGEVPAIRRVILKSCEAANLAYQDKEAPILPELEMDPLTRGLPHCLVRVEGLERRWRFETWSAPRALEFKDHMLVPHVVGVVVGETLHVTSRSTGCCHNLHWMGKLNRMQLTNVTLKLDERVGFDSFKRPELAHFKDDCHGWIKAWVHVLPHPVFAVTDEAGRFALPKLPPGDYEIAVWHEKWKAMPQRVVLGAEHATRGKYIRFELRDAEWPRR